MRSTKSIILIVIALGCGTIAAIGMRQAMARPDTSTATETETIFVAVSSVPSWTKLSADVVKQEEWPKDKVPQGAARTMEEFEGKSSLYPLYPGEPIILTKITDGDGAYASERIPEGHQVFAVKVDRESALSGLINPGDKVDVLVFVRGRDGVRTGTRTIMRNVTVFAVNDQIARIQEGESSIDAKTVSLLVQPAQSEKLLLAKQLGTIHLALRKPGDESKMETEGALPGDLDDQSTQGSDGMLADAGTSNTGIFGILNGMKGDGSTAVDSSNAAAASTSGMVIMSPEGVLGTYTFNGESGQGGLPTLPVELMSDFVESGTRNVSTDPETSGMGEEGDGFSEDSPGASAEGDLDILDPADLGL